MKQAGFRSCYQLVLGYLACQVLLVVLVDGAAAPVAQLAFVGEIDQVALEEIHIQAEDTIQEEDHHMACQEIRVQVEILEEQSADWVAGTDKDMVVVRTAVGDHVVAVDVEDVAAVGLAEAAGVWPVVPEVSA